MTKVVRFGPFELDRASGQLCRDDEEIALVPKALAVLECLLESQGRTVSKAELLERAWNGTAVTEHSLIETIRILRQALDDNPRRPRYIRTVHRRGYQFLAAVETSPSVLALSRDAGAVRRQWRPVVLAGAGVLGLVAASASLPWFPAAAPAVIRFAVASPQNAVFNPASQGLVITPDGSTLLYEVSTPRSRVLYRRALSELDATPVPMVTEPEITWMARPFVSPDGTRLGFFQRNALKVLSLSDLQITTLCDPCADPIGDRGMAGATWSSGDSIVFANDSLLRISAAGGEPEVIASPEGGSYLWPSFLPDDRWLVATRRRGVTVHDAEIVVVDSHTGASHVVVDDGANARYVSTGHLIFLRAGDIWAVAFDLGALAPTGEPELVLKGVLMSDSLGEAMLTVSETGTLAYQPGTMWTRDFAVVSADRQGAVQPLIQERRNFRAVRVSPTGTHLAAGVLDRGDFNIWVYDLERSTHVSITGAGRDDSDPVWSPDGSRIAFASHDGKTQRIFWTYADGRTPRSDLETELAASESWVIPSSWSPDGKTIAYWTQSPTTGNDIWTVSVDRGNAQPFLQTAADEMTPAFSPDGRWLAYTSDGEVRVTAYPGREATITIDADSGGMYPRWSSDGQSLYYFWNSLWRVAISAESELRAGPPQRLPVKGYRNAYYDVAPDEQSFVLVDRTWERPTTDEIVVVVNWFEELKRLVPTGR